MNTLNEFRQNDCKVEELIFNRKILDTAWPCSYDPEDGMLRANTVALNKQDNTFKASYDVLEPIRLKSYDHAVWPPRLYSDVYDKQYPRNIDFWIADVEIIPFYTSEHNDDWIVLNYIQNNWSEKDKKLFTQIFGSIIEYEVGDFSRTALKIITIKENN